MKSAAEASERLACIILGAQVKLLRDRIDSDARRTTEMLERLSGLVLDTARRRHAPGPATADQNAAATAADAEIIASLDRLAFLEAQRHDFARQMADCLVTGLERLGAADAPAGARLSPDDLAALYVCEDQRKVHDAVTRQSGVEVSRDQSPNTEKRDRKGTGK
jgi:hypothetical protein